MSLGCDNWLWEAVLFCLVLTTHLDPVAEHPVHICSEKTEKQVEMNLVPKTPHLSEVEEDEDGQEEGDDGHGVPQEEDEDPPLLYRPSSHL